MANSYHGSIEETSTCQYISSKEINDGTSQRSCLFYNSKETVPQSRYPIGVMMTWSHMTLTCKILLIFNSFLSLFSLNTARDEHSMLGAMI